MPPLQYPLQTDWSIDDFLDGFCKHFHHKIGVFPALELHTDCALTSERYRSSRLGRQAFTLRLPPVLRCDLGSHQDTHDVLSNADIMFYPRSVQPLEEFPCLQPQAQGNNSGHGSSLLHTETHSLWTWDVPRLRGSTRLSLFRFNAAGVLDEDLSGLGQITAIGRRQGTANPPSDSGTRP
jgi:hypothetical protein